MTFQAFRSRGIKANRDDLMCENKIFPTVTPSSYLATGTGSANQLQTASVAVIITS